MATETERDRGEVDQSGMHAFEASPASLVDRLRRASERAKAEMKSPELPLSIEDAIRAGREDHDPGLR